MLYSHRCRRETAPALGFGGRYLIDASSACRTNATGNRRVDIRRLRNAFTSSAGSILGQALPATRLVHPATDTDAGF